MVVRHTVFSATDPRGMDWSRWSALIAEDLADYNVPNPVGEDSWFNWACSLFDVPDLVNLGIPDPRGFEDWRGWAEQFVQGLNT